MRSVERRGQRTKWECRWLSYALTIFLSAFLLFQVEPMIAKMIVPWFGGSASVWTACLLFFQTVLLLGYAYAHWSTARLKSRGAKGGCMWGLLLVSLAALPSLIALRSGAGGHWAPAGNEEPTGRILLLLLVTIGLPFFLLSSTGPLLQAWAAHLVEPGQVAVPAVRAVQRRVAAGAAGVPGA